MTSATRHFDADAALTADLSDPAVLLHYDHLRGLECPACDFDATDVETCIACGYAYSADGLTTIDDAHDELCCRLYGPAMCKAQGFLCRTHGTGLGD